MSKHKVFIDAGHGGKDGGAGANGLSEKKLTLKIAKKVRKLLKKQGGYSIKMARSSDKYLTLTERTNNANAWGADIFVSIHINAGGGTGFETYIYNGNVSDNTHKLQSAIHAAIMKQIDVADRGQKRANLAVVRQSKMPAVLTESLFIDTAKDAKRLKDDNFLDKVALGHANGIADYFGGKAVKPKKKSKSKPKAKTKSTTTKKSKANLTVDGKWGKDTTRALQKALGTPVDGVISSQPRNSVTQAMYSGVKFGSKGSPMVRALQKKIGASADGKLGPETVRKLQAYLGTVKDGKLSRPSLVVKEMQRRLNAGNF